MTNSAIIAKWYVQQLQSVKGRLELEWTFFLPHPPYLPDFAQTDYYLFYFLKNFSKVKILNSEGKIKQVDENFFLSKSVQFYKEVIKK